ncbi:MAG: sigma-70 family RNA polymerase sigma factor [Thermoflavifilum sp.]|uniref:sigma-70 family RNA polymerase sigma factor n=1 Tax=Thermoflavifilum sp. TaxID=1968839 RepID=UPI0018A3510F|nr:sigma-70 family RNA polymerase sigma factor [Thermoflavifilum sp.]QOR76855.1 MAG: sigma-70 family RNA polymerase sigma factor [Thermoflavifilum sp.]
MNTKIWIKAAWGVAHRMGRAYGLSDADTEDAMQESFIQAYMQLKQLKRPRAFQKWLATIMVHTCYHIQKRIQPEEIQETMSAAEFTPGFENNNLRHVLEQAILQLPATYRLPFVLKELNGYSLKDTAQILHLSTVNTKIRLFRARQILKRYLQQSHIAEELLVFEAPRCEALTQRVMQTIHHIP